VGGSRRGGIVKGEAVVGVLAGLVFGLVFTGPLIWWLAVLGWAFGVALGASFVLRRIEVTAAEVVEHRILFLNRRYARADVTAVALRGTSIGEIGLPAAAPYLRFSSSAPDRRLLALMQYAFTDRGVVKARQSAQWLADQLGVPLADEGDRWDENERSA
jgi:hypothetical protein